ncbi:MAG TPA: GDP-mannose 4,6-dehydratase [Bacteroidales bacterium]|nr:GDP-mannose 4,6-dehydratase [Bacteroidales bacterium]
MSGRPSILITGGGGYLGSMLARSLLDAGHDLHLADICFSEAALKEFPRYSQVYLHTLDLRDAVAVERLCRVAEPAHIFHLAAMIDRSRDPALMAPMLEVNLGGTLNLLMGLKDIPYLSFGFSSTSEIYGNKNPLPFTEDMPPQPVSPYSLSKWMAEDLIRSWSGMLGKPWRVFRIFNFYGPGMPPQTFIPQLLESLERRTSFHMTPGAQRRDYLHVHDLLWYLREMVLGEMLQNEVINLCSGESVSMDEIADKLTPREQDRALLHKDLPYRENEIWDIRGDASKLRTAFPHHRPRRIEEGLQGLVR